MCIGPELGIFLEPLVLQEREFVSLAVNDNASTNTAGGSHWYVETQRFSSARTCLLVPNVLLCLGVHLCMSGRRMRFIILTLGHQQTLLLQRHVLRR